ncbi:hypothetical protein FRC00_002920 [Tulasnella sp. 408]|nr:hypothetical protein FRC00_002920 [Tulasnella sp. 408]
MLAKDCYSFLRIRKYKNYRIPSGSMIFTNYWSISRDPALFDGPENFMPERYIQHPQGFGKALRSQLEQQGSDDIGFLKLWPSVAFGIGKASKTRYRAFLELRSPSTATSALGLLNTLRLFAKATEMQLQYLNPLSRSCAKQIGNGWLPPELTDSEFYVGLPASYVMIRFKAL